MEAIELRASRSLLLPFSQVLLRALRAVSGDADTLTSFSGGWVGALLLVFGATRCSQRVHKQLALPSSAVTVCFS